MLFDFVVRGILEDANTMPRTRAFVNYSPSFEIKIGPFADVLFQTDEPENF